MINILQYNGKFYIFTKYTVGLDILAQHVNICFRLSNFSKATELISIKFGRKHLKGMEILVCENQGCNVDIYCKKA